MCTGDHGRPFRLCISNDLTRNQVDLQQLLTDWSMGSYSLHALVGFGDLTCIQLDRFTADGSKNKCKLTWSGRVCLPFYVVKVVMDNQGQLGVEDGANMFTFDRSGASTEDIT